MKTKKERLKQEYRVAMQDKRRPGVRYLARMDGSGNWHCGQCFRRIVMDLALECRCCHAFIISIETMGDSVIQIHRYMKMPW